MKTSDIDNCDIEDIEDYLKANGWYFSKKFKKPLNKHLKPIPWVCYDALAFIELHLPTINDIFEYSCGYSTLYYYLKNKNISFVEHDEKWFNFVKQSPFDFKSNALITNKEDYINFIEKSHAKKYDFISVDGAFRRESILKAIDYIKDDGFIALDNSERRTYQSITKLMYERGFNFIKFKGIGPIRLKPKETTFFFKTLRHVAL